MDNNCAAVSFPDFTRGHWNDQQGYRHAYASAEDEAATAAAAAASTEAQKSVTSKYNLWALYDAAQNAATPKARAKAEKAYRKALTKANTEIAKR